MLQISVQQCFANILFHFIQRVAALKKELELFLDDDVNIKFYTIDSKISLVLLTRQSVFFTSDPICLIYIHLEFVDKCSTFLC